MFSSAFLALLLAPFVLLLGEAVNRRWKTLARFNIPTPVTGGFIVALVLLLARVFFGSTWQFNTDTVARAWTWFVTTGLASADAPTVPLVLPLVVIFYTTLGFSASASLVRRGSTFLVLFLISTFLVCCLQNAAGVGLARAMNASPILGLVCGSATLMGGFSTAVGFAPQFAELGFTAAPAVGIAAATFGLVASNVVSAPVGTVIIRRHRLGNCAADAAAAPENTNATATATRPTSRVPSWWRETLALGHSPGRLVSMLVLLFACAKISAYVTHWITQTGFTFPVQIGAMCVGIIVRNLHDAARLQWIDVDLVDRIGSVVLGLFIAVVMMTLDLSRLAGVAGPMLVVLVAQVALLTLYAFAVNFRLMGSNYEAAVTSSGLLGFGLGATPNAITAMKALVASFGPAPRAFLVVPVTGAFLSDVINVLVLTAALNLLR